MKYFNCSVFSLCIFSFIVFTFQSCTNPISPANGFTLSVADVSCTEAWLNLHVNTAPAIITINKNGAALFTMKVTTRDTTIYDSTLSPGKNYTYQALVTGIKSNTATVRTMDTTSHNFTWQTIVLGSALNNYFNDVAIISANDIWCVGKFNLQDSIGMYNVMHWDGNKWNPIRLWGSCRVYWPDCGPDTLSVSYGSSIIAFNSKNIWIVAGNIFHYNGSEWLRYGGTDANNGDAIRIWGTDDSNLWFVGYNGFISHYDGTTFQKIESGTSLNIQDIWGAIDPITGEKKILCVASDIFTTDGNMLLQIKDNKVQVVSNQGLLSYYYSSCWFKNSNLAYVAGSGVYKSRNFFDNANWSEVTPRITTYYTDVIRGNDVNDLVLCGSNGDIAHFNGVSWKDYMADNELQNFQGHLYGLAIKGNTICAAGSINNQAIIIIGRRN